MWLVVRLLWFYCLSSFELQVGKVRQGRLSGSVMFELFSRQFYQFQLTFFNLLIKLWLIFGEAGVFWNTATMRWLIKESVTL
jgi:hypothetical protein